MDGDSLKDLGVEVWRGEVNPWECDDLGRMTVRFHVARAMEGLAGLAAELGMPHAFSPRANATLLVREHHIRFLREARSRASLHMRGWVAEIGETGARVVLALFHAGGGEPVATFQTLVDHVTPVDGRPFPWSMASRIKGAALTGPVPDFAAARALSLDPFESRASLQRADALGLKAIGAGALSNHDGDAFGRTRAEHFIPVVTDGIPGLPGVSRAAMRPGLETPPAKVGETVLECRLAYLTWPRAGDRFVIRAGLAGADDRTWRMIHWMLDPATGKAWGASEAVTAMVDVDRHRVVPLSPEAQAAMNAIVVEGLSL